MTDPSDLDDAARGEVEAVADAVEQAGEDEPLPDWVLDLPEDERQAFLENAGLDD